MSSRIVALRKESVDRNFDTMQVIVIIMDVALRKESVDRNNRRFATIHNTEMSLSARRAWIEIALKRSKTMKNRRVALRKESVDRNREQFKYVVQCRVALRKESVDRNLYLSSFALASLCRSPQGERG